MHGAEAVGIEFREESLAKARFAKDYFGLDRFSFYQDDVRNLSREKYGEFDVVICPEIPITRTYPTFSNSFIVSTMFVRA
jgi:2-polyprenyl-3-methyl-5-hydroxy-6-metoxy-1,4-benzoquinol methylase